MASQKKQRKAARQAHKQHRAQGAAFRHRDGDRRNRGLSARIEDAVATKRAMQQGEIPVHAERQD